MTYHPTPVQGQHRNGLGITGLVLGLVGILFGLVPFTFWIAGPLGVTGLVLGLVGWARARRHEASNGKTAVFGVVTSTLALALSFYGAYVVFAAVEEIDDSVNDFDRYLECVEDVPLDAPDFDARMTECDRILE